MGEEHIFLKFIKNQFHLLSTKLSNTHEVMNRLPNLQVNNFFFYATFDSLSKISKVSYLLFDKGTRKTEVNRCFSCSIIRFLMETFSFISRFHFQHNTIFLWKKYNARLMFVRNTEKGALCHEIHIVENFSVRNTICWMGYFKLRPFERNLSSWKTI